MSLLLFLLLSLCTHFSANSMNAPAAPPATHSETKISADSESAESFENFTSRFAKFGMKEKDWHDKVLTTAEIVRLYPPLPYMAAWHHCDHRMYASLRAYLFNRLPVDTCDSDGLTGLHMVVRYANLAGVKLFLKYNADPNIAEKHEAQTPLHTALLNLGIYSGPIDFARVDPRYLHNPYGYYARMYRAYLEVIKELLKSDVDYHQPNIFGKSAFQLALTSGNKKVSSLFMITERGREKRALKKNKLH